MGIAKLLNDADSDVRDVAAAALGQVGGAELLLREKDPHIRNMALRFNGGAGKDGKDAFPRSDVFNTLLADDDWIVRHSAVHALAQLGEAAVPHVAALVHRGIEDEQWYVRHAALQVLAKLGVAVA